MKEKMKLAVRNPNLSVILPTGCNAHCPFCYWKQGVGLTTDRFSFVSSSLPGIFDQCTITGGEPTLSNELTEYLEIARSRFLKVVLNTNGSHLKPEHIRLVSYVNISRHHYDDYENAKIFGTPSVPCTNEIRAFCDRGDVTLNCFLPNNFKNGDFIARYIVFAKSVGAKVAFRKYFGDLTVLSSVDRDDTLIGKHSCGACLHRWHEIDGVDVTFKYGVQETSEHVDGIYELILQPNGDLTFDWAGKNKLVYKEVPAVWTFNNEAVYEYSSKNTGCGNSEFSSVAPKAQKHLISTNTGCGYRGCSHS